MTPLGITVAGWLLSEDDGGEAAVGDLAELHADWSTRHGERAAALLLGLEVLRSLPCYLALGLERRRGVVMLRTLPRRLRSTAAIVSGLLVLAGGCLGRSSGTTGRGEVTRQFLSDGFNDWEPSLATGDGWVHVLATRNPPVSGEAARIPKPEIVTWSSADGGVTFGPGRTQPGGGDARIKADEHGRVFGSWIRLEWDSATARPDLTRGGLVLARSDDHGAQWRTSLAATMASGVADKPELAVSNDGRAVYLAFMARGTLDVVASPDGGESWQRHTADTTRTMHWPTGMALAANGDLYVTNVRQVRGGSGDSVLTMRQQLLRSADRGRSWQTHEIASSTRLAAIDQCVHGTTCPVQIPYASVAAGAGGNVYLVYTEGTSRAPYTLHFKRSLDRGATWSEPVALSRAQRAAADGQADHYYPMIAAGENGVVYVVWFDDRAGPIHVFARRSDDGGATWGGEVRLSGPDGLAGIYGEYGGIAIGAEGELHVVWSDGTGHVARGGRGGTWHARWSGGRPQL